jgi:hypothetical protein
MRMNPKVHLVDVESLRHIEGWSRRRVDWLVKKIEREGVWRVPLALDRKHHLVMDGQHRMEAAKRLGLAVVPAVLFSYDQVEVWSLRPSHEVTAALIRARALAGAPYPYKTAKHRFPAALPALEIPLADLRPRRLRRCA